MWCTISAVEYFGLKRTRVDLLVFWNYDFTQYVYSWSSVLTIFDSTNVENVADPLWNEAVKVVKDTIRESLTNKSFDVI